MDIWQWTEQLADDFEEQGLPQFAELVNEYPSDCLDGDRETVESRLVELLAVAEQLSFPWLEVFARHWHLQHLLGTHNDIKAGLPAAVRLLEISHRDENRDCPQSICAVQDLCIAYGFADGPGFAEERKEVCREALARIDPTWSCFACISAEYAGALLDEARAGEALDFLKQQGRRIKRWDRSTELDVREAEACLQTGAVEEALELTQRSSSGGVTSGLERSALRAAALARLGRPAEALKALPSLPKIRSYPAVAARFSATLLELVEAGALPLHEKSRLGRDLAALPDLAAQLAERGALRRAFDVLAVAAELRLRRGDQQEAAAAIAGLRGLLPQLRKSCGADRQIEALAARLAAP